MPQYLTDIATCLRVTDFSETSQIVTLFSAAHGVIPVIAKGSKREHKAGAGTFSGPLDLLTSGQIVFIPAKGAAELGTLTAWDLTDSRHGLRRNLPAQCAAMVCVEITLALVRPHDPHPELYREFLAALALLPTAHRARALVAYAKSALTEAGYAPQLDACVSCATPVAPDDRVRYSPVAGGIVCGKANCRPTGTLTPVAGRIALALARLPSPAELLASPPDRPADPAALRTALELLLGHIEAITDRGLRTRSVLGTIFTA